MLPLALLLGLEICVFDPLLVVSVNAAEFPASVGEILPILLLGAAGVTLVILLAGALVWHRRQPVVRVLLLGLALALWAQRSFLLYDYGLFDGRGIDWDRFAWHGWLDLALWVGIIVLALRFRRSLSRQTTFVAMALLVLQGGLTLVQVAGTERPEPAEGVNERGDEPPAGIFQWSSTRNVVHVILDSFQSDLFAEIVERENWADEFEGFLFFPENMGVAVSTSYSVPAIFSGEIYDGTEPFADYFDRALSEKAFPNRLDEAGYVVNLVPHLPMHATRHDHYFTAPALWGEASQRRRRHAAALALDVSLFRHSPHFLRRWVHAGGEWRLSRWAGATPTARSFHQKAFFRDWIDRLEVDGPTPRYHFLHLMPPHPPYVTLPDGSYAGRILPSTRENYRHEARAVLAIFVDLLRAMKREGIYRDSLILMHGDHGSRFPPIFEGSERPIVQERVPALLLVKPPGATGPLRTEPQWSSLADIPATVMHTLQLKHDFPGRDLLSLEPGPRGGRSFFVVEDPQAETPTVTTYRVEGSIFEPSSWTVQSKRSVEREAGAYAWGTTIQFGVNGNAQRYQGRGWSQPAARAEWTNGELAELHLRTKPAPGDMLLEVVMRPFLLEDRVTSQPVEVMLNGVSLAELEANSEGYVMFRRRIPREDLQGEVQDLAFRLPGCVSPVEVGAGGDRRCLGISVGQVRLRPIP